MLSLLEKVFLFMGYSLTLYTILGVTIVYYNRFLLKIHANLSQILQF